MLGDGEQGTAVGQLLPRSTITAHYAQYATGRQRIGIDRIAGNNDFLLTAYEGEHDFTLVLQNSAETYLGGLQFALPVNVSRVEAIESTAETTMVDKHVALSADKKSVVINVGAKSIISIKLLK